HTADLIRVPPHQDGVEHLSALLHAERFGELGGDRVCEPLIDRVHVIALDEKGIEFTVRAGDVSVEADSDVVDEFSHGSPFTTYVVLGQCSTRVVVADRLFAWRRTMSEDG